MAEPFVPPSKPTPYVSHLVHALVGQKTERFAIQIQVQPSVLTAVYFRREEIREIVAKRRIAPARGDAAVPVFGFATEVRGGAEVAIGHAIAVAVEDPYSYDGPSVGERVMLFMTLFAVEIEVEVDIIVGAEDGGGVIMSSFSRMKMVVVVKVVY